MDVMSIVSSLHVFSMRMILCCCHHLFLVNYPCLIFVLAFVCVVMLRLMLRRVFALPLLGRNSNLSLFLL